MPHPPLLIPAVGRGKEKEIPNTLVAMERVALEIKDLAPETIIFVTPHSTIYADYFHISPGQSASGDFARFGSHATYLETTYDCALVNEISKLVARNGIYAGTDGERDAQLDHGVMVPMWYTNKHFTDYRSIRVSQSGLSKAEHYSFGQAIAKAVELSGRRVVLVASSDLSHKLREDAPYGFATEGAKFDSAVTQSLSSGDFLSLFEIPHTLREAAGECGYNSLMILAGCFDRLDVETELMSYECPFGVGYAVASFEPKGECESRNILEKYVERVEKRMADMRKTESRHQELARRSLERKIRSNETTSVYKDLPDEMLNVRAGVFVSIHKDSMLRGCIGTISPTTQNIADEIVQNAISAGLNDSRFSPVTAEELPLLQYKVDVLSAPEKIDGIDELDVKRYGVIVKSGLKRGLLLPNLDGVDTVEEQVEIARNKAGIRKDEKIELERFEVTRYE